MHGKFGNRLVKYRYPIDLMDRSSNMEIGACWYQKGANNKWTYNLTDRLMVDLETIIAVAYELHPRDGKSLQ